VRPATVRGRTFAEVFAPPPVAAKVPEITVMFWVIKILTTAGGEAVSDYLALGSRLAGGAVETGLLIIGLVWQFRTRRYTAAAYWFLRDRDLRDRGLGHPAPVRRHPLRGHHAAVGRGPRPDLLALGP
jgi:hypothetical protein